MSIKLLKDLQFAEKLNSTEAITEAGKEILKNYRSYCYSNAATYGIVNGFVLEASKVSFDTGLMSILESVNKFISENNISWKLATACESILNNNSTYNYINKLGVQQVEKLLEMSEADIVSYIKAGSLKNIQYIPEFRQICKEIYKQHINEVSAPTYTIKTPVSFVLCQEGSQIFRVLGKVFEMKDGKINDATVDNKDFYVINDILENFASDGENIVYEYRSSNNELNKFVISENELIFTRGSKINEKFDTSAKFIEYTNTLSRMLPINEKLTFMNVANSVAKVFENVDNVLSLDNVKVMNCSNGTQLAIVEAKDNVNLTVFHSVNAGSSSNNYDYMVEALNNVIKVSGVDLKSMYEERINEDCKKADPQAQEIKEQLEANKEAQFDIRKKKIAMLAEQYKNDPVKIALLNKVAKDLAILEKKD